MVMTGSNYNYNNNYSPNWRKPPRKENFYEFNQVGHASSRPRSQNNRRSSFGNGCHPSVPSWEKKFCATVGLVSWQKLLETKKYMHQDVKILEWNDSAVEEAFWNAKRRFWAEMNGHPCNIKPPDPDIFIDKVDWDSTVDPDLISDLENRKLDFPSEAENQDGGVVVGIPVIPEQYLMTPNGWGDAEEWGPQLKSRDDTNGYDRRDDDGANEEVRGDSRGRVNGYANVPRHSRDGIGGRGSTWDHGSYKKSVHGLRLEVSRAPRHNGNGCLLGDDYGNKKGNFGYERPMFKWRPVMRQW